jgi:hypothetical protein
VVSTRRGDTLPRKISTKTKQPAEVPLRFGLLAHRFSKPTKQWFLTHLTRNTRYFSAGAEQKTKGSGPHASE